MANVFVVLWHDYEGGDSHAGEFSSPTEVVGVFTDSTKAGNYVDEQLKGKDPGSLSYGYEVEERELDVGE